MPSPGTLLIGKLPGEVTAADDEIGEKFGPMGEKVDEPTVESGPGVSGTFVGVLSVNGRTPPSSGFSISTWSYCAGVTRWARWRWR